MDSDHGSEGDDLLTMLQRMKEKAQTEEVSEPPEQTKDPVDSSISTGKVSNQWGAASAKPSGTVPELEGNQIEQSSQSVGQATDRAVPEPRDTELSTVAPWSWGESQAPLYNDDLGFDESAPEGPGQVFSSEGSHPPQGGSEADTIEISRDHVEHVAALRKQGRAEMSSPKPPLQTWGDDEGLGEVFDALSRRSEDSDTLVDARPQRYTHPTRTVPLGPEYENPRVLSSSNLVGAPPPKPGATSFRVKIAPAMGRFKELVFLLVLLLGVLCGILFLMFSVQQQDVNFDVGDVQKQSTRLRDSGQKSDLLDQAALDLAEMGLDQAEIGKQGSNSLALKPQFAINILETSDIDEYKDLLGKLQRDGFEVSVQVLEDGTLFVLRVLEVDRSAIEEVLERLLALDYLEGANLQVVPLGAEFDVGEDRNQDMPQDLDS